ncbi:MAG: transposase zinc-binding domain-containing protein, partial [Candidatus Tectomicrobia bacterium]|nr:transposase zinc-binding domain-containing protein [Candidatus Tectomicrobia bacterium]
MPELAEIFRRYGPAYQERFGDRMPPSHQRALHDIAACRPETLGGHGFQCDQCGSLQYAYHSCRNRSRPSCHRHDTETWLEDRRAELLPVTSCHLVFTLPKALHDFVRSHQTVLYPVLMQAAVRALMHLARDPRYVGGQLGVLCVLAKSALRRGAPAFWLVSATGHSGHCQNRGSLQAGHIPTGGLPT